ncbi:MAG: metallophosphoesterase, partial [Bacilli bacterium]|nr:metallophosphoesterase [Bacilli bacterium]
MKFYIKEYSIENSRVLKDITVAHLSDLDYCSKIGRDLLYAIVREVAVAAPDMICFTGDIIDDASLFENPKIKGIIHEWLKVLGNIAPVFIVRGNHDCLARDGVKWKYYDSDHYFEEMNNIPGVKVLKEENPIAHFVDNINLAGFDVGKNTVAYYEEEHESRKGFELYTAPILQKVSEQLNPEEVNLLLLHSPVHLYDDAHDEYTCLLSGHMHNGCVPDVIDKIMPGNRGIIPPIGKPFPKFARGTYNLSENTTGIIASPLVLIPKYYDNQLVRKLYKPGIT